MQSMQSTPQHFGSHLDSSWASTGLILSEKVSSFEYSSDGQAMVIALWENGLCGLRSHPNVYSFWMFKFQKS